MDEDDGAKASSSKKTSVKKMNKDLDNLAEYGSKVLNEASSSKKECEN